MHSQRIPGILTLGAAALAALVLGACDGSTSEPQPTVASVTIEPAGPGITAGQTVQLTATARDASGAPIQGKTFTWQSQSEMVATVSGSGLVTGNQAGAAVITASVDGRTGQSTVTVSAPSSVIVTSVAPTTLNAGETATITGEGFGATPAANTVTIGGAPAQVVNASSTSLTVTVPPTVCRPSGEVVVRVVVAGEAGEKRHPWQAGAALNAPLGQLVRLDPASTFCIQLAANSGTSEFLIGVQSVTGVATTLTPVTVQGSVPGSAPSASSAPSVSARPTFAQPSTFTLRSGLNLPVSRAADRRERHRTAELQHRQRELRFLATRRPGTDPLLRAQASGMQAAVVDAAVPGTVAVDDTVDVKYPQTLNSCTAFTPLRAVVRRVGTRAIWVEDVGNPTGGFSAANYNTLGTQFDATIGATNTAYFGEPTDFDGNSRIVIIITKEINKENNTLGRVYSADFFPADCPASNGGEYFYGIAPDPTGTYGDAYTVADALLDMPFIIAHEMAHVIQFGRRLTTPGATDFQTLWELEGQATLAEEVVGHAITGNQPRQNYGFSVAWNEPQSTAVDWYINGFVDLALYFGFESQTSSVPGAPEQCGWLGRPENGSMGPCIGGRSLYGVTWSFLRWISDHYGPTFPGGEQGLHRALVADTRTGFATIGGVVGEPIDMLLAHWAATLYVDDRLGGANTLLTLPSWNLNGALPDGIFSRLFEPAQLRPRARGFTAFEDNVSVRAGSTAYYRLSGTGHPAGAFSATGTGGAALPSHMRVWIVRLQ